MLILLLMSEIAKFDSFSPAGL